MLAAIDLDDIPRSTGEMTHRSELEISTAVQECAGMCLGCASPKERARDYVARLVAEGWSERDTREVLIGSLEVISRLAHHFASDDN